MIVKNLLFGNFDFLGLIIPGRGTIKVDDSFFHDVRVVGMVKNRDISISEYEKPCVEDICLVTEKTEEVTENDVVTIDFTDVETSEKNDDFPVDKYSDVLTDEPRNGQNTSSKWKKNRKSTQN